MLDSNSDGTIKNYMEDCVWDVLDTIITRLNVCTCDVCRKDMTAITLNSLPPKYVVTRKGEFYAKLNALQQQFEVDIIASLTKAAKMVGENPRH